MSKNVLVWGSISNLRSIIIRKYRLHLTDGELRFSFRWFAVKTCAREISWCWRIFKQCWEVIHSANWVWRDVWINMSTNWVDFFWLTGETPQTLGQLVDQLDQTFIHLFNNRRGCKLDIRNQVSFSHHTQIQIPNLYTYIFFPFVNCLFDRFYLHLCGLDVILLCII